MIDQPVFISLTTISSRIKTIPQVLDCLLHQSITPSTTVAVSLRDTHLPWRLRRKLDEHCLTGNHIGSLGLVAAGGQGTDASVVHAGRGCRISACIPRWSAWARATQDRLDAC